MGNSPGSPPIEGCLRLPHDGCLSHEGFPPLDRKERYDRLKIILSESYDTVNDLHDSYAKKVIPSEFKQKIIKHTVTTFSMMTQLSDEEAEQIGNKTNEALEKYWLKCSMRIILSVINRLYQVQKDKNDQQTNLTEDQLKNLNNLLNKSKTNCLPLLNVEMDQSSNDAQKTDEREPNSSREERKNNSKNSEKKNGENETSYGDRSNDQHEKFFLLYTCTLILKTELDSCTDICKYT